MSVPGRKEKTITELSNLTNNNKMRNFTEKKLFLTVMSASYTLRGFAQDARGAINDVLDSFTLPVFGSFMLGGIILGLIQQWDNIIDKENRGTRKEGFVALGWYVGFALLAAVVVSAVKSAISGISLSI